MPEGATHAEVESFGSPPARSRPRARSIVAGKRIPEIRVAMREIDLEPSANEPPVRVYDTSGPYSDPAVDDRHPPRACPNCASRGSWRAAMSRTIERPRGQARGQRPAPRRERARCRCSTAAGRQVLRAKPGAAVTQLAYARARHHHAGDGIRRDPRESRPREAARERRRATASRSARRSPIT